MTRISELPRRDWTTDAADLAGQLTELLRTPVGCQVLRPIQAAALAELATCNGVFVQARVGAGKTLISGLAPTVLGSTRPILLVKASLVEKTRREFDALRVHWQIPAFYRIESYSKLGLDAHAHVLDTYKPDLICADEAQCLKHVTASAVARRVARYMASDDGRTCRFVPLSGSMSKDSILDYWHLLVWALRSGAPVPLDRTIAEIWASAIDASPAMRTNPDDLVPDLGAGILAGVGATREAYRERKIQTPGVIVSSDAFTGSELTIEPIELDVPDAMIAPFDMLRETWQAPDGWLFADPRFECWAAARQLALGFYYRHEPWPPDDWWQARKAWCKLVRDVLEASDALDSEFQVAEAARTGQLGPRGTDTWTEWNEIRPTFEITKIPTWLSDHALVAAERWGAKAKGGIVWTVHRAFAFELSRRTGWKTFGSAGIDVTGRPLESVPGSEIVIASVQANSTGRNLQAFNRSLIVSPSPDAREWEQTLGRYHRDGQTARRCTAAYFLGCHEHTTSVAKALREAAYIVESSIQPQKILDAGLRLPDNCGVPSHPAWQPTKSKGSDE